MRRLAPTALVVALALAAPPIAAGHGGTVLADERAGAYQVLVQAAPLAEAETPGGAGAVDFTVGLRDAESGGPVNDATVTVTIDTGSTRRGPLTAKLVEGRYEVLMPRERGEKWNRWKVYVDVSGSAGTAAVSYDPPTGSTPSWLPYVIAVLLPLSFAAFVMRQRARRFEAREAEEEQPA